MTGSRRGAGPIDRDAALRIRLVSFDVDGVLTDGSVWALDAGDGDLSGKAFDVRDGLAIRLLRRAGLEVAFVSGRCSPVVTARAVELGVRHVHLGDPSGRIEALEGTLSSRGWEWANLAHMGDDLPDLPVFERAGLSAAPSSAVDEVRAAADWVAARPGGKGAVREFGEALLKARGAWGELVERYVADGG